jgi:hypothetical protein
MNVFEAAAHAKLDRVMLHKNSDDDVLLCYGRGPLAALLPVEAVARMEKGDREYLTSFYKADQGGHEAKEGASAGFYYLRTLPVFISKQAAAIGKRPLQSVLGQHYRDAGDGYQLVSPYINEMDEVVLAQCLGRAEEWIHEGERAEISDRLKKHKVALPQVYFATFYNDLSNYFFYRKHHEHVPGTMLIEAARQGYYAQFYLTTGVRPGEVSISMDSLHADFAEYTNPNYPVRIMVDDVDPNLPHNNRRQIHKRATFQQVGRIVGQVEMRGHVMRMREFKRMRTIAFPEQHRFFPVKNISRFVSLTDRQGKTLECSLDQLAAKSLTVTFPNGSRFSPGQVFDFIFFVDGVGFVDGRAELTAGCGESARTADLSIIASSDESNERLLGVIRNFTHAVTTREVF